MYKIWSSEGAGLQTDTGIHDPKKLLLNGSYWTFRKTDEKLSTDC